MVVLTNYYSRGCVNPFMYVLFHRQKLLVSACGNKWGTGQPFTEAGIDVTIPHSGEIDYIADKIHDELERNIIEPQTREMFTAHIKRWMYKDESTEAIIQGYTELRVRSYPLMYWILLIFTSKRCLKLFSSKKHQCFENNWRVLLQYS